MHCLLCSGATYALGPHACRACVSVWLLKMTTFADALAVLSMFAVALAVDACMLCSERRLMLFYRATAGCASWIREPFRPTLETAQTQTLVSEKP